MLFNDLNFIYYLLPTLVLFYLINRTQRIGLKNSFLLAVSYLFYGLFESKFLFVLMYITLINYITIILLGKSNNSNKRKCLIISNIILSLIPLVFFKYTYFILNDVLGMQGEIIGKIALPVGISFYTFQALSYTIDIYRGKEKELPTLLNFALYTSFFPTVLSGPIERARTLMPQIKNLQRWNFSRFINGIQLFCWGLVQKIVVADRISEYVGYVYEHPSMYGTTTIILAASLYSIQIYCDFAGYSNMAIGVGRMLGFDIRKNFDFPYFTTSIRSFWKKWHISLTSWFTEYLYISLGGNRVKEYRWVINILIVFLVSGIWHGSAWTFIIWGLIHGIYQIIEHYTINKKEIKNHFIRFTQGCLLFIVVTIAWTFFRANNIDHAITVLSSLKNIEIPLFTMFATQWMLMWGVLFVFIISELLLYKRYIKIIETGDNPFLWNNLIFWISCVSMITLLGKSGASFVYFQF